MSNATTEQTNISQLLKDIIQTKLEDKNLSKREQQRLQDLSIALDNKWSFYKEAWMQSIFSQLISSLETIHPLSKLKGELSYVNNFEKHVRRVDFGTVSNHCITKIIQHPWIFPDMKKELKQPFVMEKNPSSTNSRVSLHVTQTLGLVRNRDSKKDKILQKAYKKICMGELMYIFLLKPEYHSVEHIQKDIVTNKYPWLAHVNAKCGNLNKIKVFFIDTANHHENTKNYIDQLNNGIITINTFYNTGGRKNRVKNKPMPSNRIERFGCVPCDVEYTRMHIFDVVNKILPYCNQQTINQIIMQLTLPGIVKIPPREHTKEEMMKTMSEFKKISRSI